MPSHFQIVMNKIHTIIKSKEYEIGKSSLIIYPSNRLTGENIKIGESTTIGKYAVITTWKASESDVWGCVEIGNRVQIGQYCHLSSSKYIKIHDGVLMGRYVSIIDNSHGTNTLNDNDISPIDRSIISKDGITIGRNVWIGDKVTICSNVTIGEGAIIGANAVVTKNIPPHTVVGGVPAKIIKYIE